MHEWRATRRYGQPLLHDRAGSGFRTMIGMDFVNESRTKSIPIMKLNLGPR